MENCNLLCIVATSVLCLMLPAGCKPETNQDPQYPVVPPVIGTAVDMGLSVKWADHNIGAISPEDFGDYFAWGEIAPKDIYSWETYKFCNGSWNTINKYNNDSYYGLIDNKISLEPEDDVATVVWGSEWRMPTMEEMEELRTRCAWTRKMLDGNAYYEVVSPVTGNSIHIPAAGYRDKERTIVAGCYYWTSNVWEQNTGFAYRLYHNNDGTNTGNNYRVHGIPVRPVKQ